MNYAKSLELYKRASKSMSGGLHSNGRFRKPHPIYFKSAQGAYATDLDGNTFIDLIMGNGSILLGHNNPEFNERFQQYMANNGGLVTGFDSQLSVEVAERFLALTHHERVRFTQTGTEAINHCLQIVRAYTGRPNIAVMEGAYDGWTDAVYVNCFAPASAIGDADRPNPVPGTCGVDTRVSQNTLVLPFNNIEASEKLIRENKDTLAAIILEPIMIDIGFVEAEPAYIQFLRRICDELGIVLIFDELLTGFRIGLGGCQEYYKTKCDLSIFGKAFANGYILAAVAGKADILDITAPGGKTAFLGTFNGHQISLCAAAATFDMIESGEVTKKIMHCADLLREGFNQLADKNGVTAHLYGKGGHFQVYFTDVVPKNYRDALTTDGAKYTQYVNAMQEHGVWCSQNPLSHHVLSLAHDEAVVEKILAAMDASLQAVHE